MHDVERGLLVLPAINGSRSLVEVVRSMDDASIRIEDIEMHKPTLDDVFLSLTGHTAEAKKADSAVKPRRARRSR
jgi:ABC-2 type transport system ATP-binding protein